MANQKQCSKCKELKPTTQFSKVSKTKDSYRSWCIECNNSYQYANSEAKLYEIINPIGERYIGVTKATLNKRFSRYKWSIQNGKTGPRLLTNSLVQHGLDNHTISLVKNLGNISRNEMFDIEKDYIKKYQPELNIMHK